MGKVTNSYVIRKGNIDSVYICMPNLLLYRLMTKVVNRQTSNLMLVNYTLGWLVVLRIQVTLAIFQPYRDLEAGDNQSLKTKWRGQVFTPGHLAPQAKSLTTRPPLLPITYWGLKMEFTLLRYQHIGLSLRRWFSD